MRTWSRNAVALFSALAALAAFATCGLARAQDIRVVDVALVAGAPIQFHRLPSPSASLAVRRMAQDRYGFLWLSAPDGLLRYDGYGFMKVPDGQSAHSVGFLIGNSLTSDRAGRLWIGADDSLNLGVVRRTPHLAWNKAGAALCPMASQLSGRPSAHAGATAALARQAVAVWHRSHAGRALHDGAAIA
jgi:hypothetical protein